MPDISGSSVLAAGISRGEARRQCARLLAAVGIDSADIDARLLLIAGGVDATGLITEPGLPLTDTERERIGALLERRLAREPISRILGRREFYGREFEVSAATLDPRPETETLVDVALSAAERLGWKKRPLRILDIGTGTGALLVTLLAEFPGATGLGTDISPAVLEVATRNAERNCVADRARWCVADGFEGLSGQFDLLVSNPPYIPTTDIAGLEPEVRCYDPLLSLDGGVDGLDVYRIVAKDIFSFVPRGLILLEVGSGQADSVATIMRNLNPCSSFTIEAHRDLGGHDRCVAIEAQ